MTKTSTKKNTRVKKINYLRLPLFALVVGTLLVGTALLVGNVRTVTQQVRAGQNLSTTTLNTIADATVKASSPNKNFGSAKTHVIDGQPISKSYIKFDLTGVDGSQLLSATLKVTFSTNSSSGIPHDVYLVPDSTWAENSIKYNNAPAATTHIGSFVGADAGTTIDATLSADIVKNYGGSKFSLVIQTTSSNASSLYAKEYQTVGLRPKLVIVTESLGASALWMNSSEIMALPISGEPGCEVGTLCNHAWQNVLEAAAHDTSSPDLSLQGDDTDVYTFAKALVYARTGNQEYRTQVKNTLSTLVADHPISDSSSWDVLGTVRALQGYVIAADLIDLKNYDGGTFDTGTFRPWLASSRTAVAEDGWLSIVTAQEKRPNNFGTHASASRIAIDLYLGDTQDLNRAVQVFKGYLGDRASYSGFSYGDLCYQANPNAPVGINPAGATLLIDGTLRNADGIIPDDQRRSSCPATYPYPKQNYAYEALQGVTVATELLYKAGYDSYNWQNQALLRAVTWLNNVANYPADGSNMTGDDTWIPWIINKRYGTNFTTVVPNNPSLGKGVGLADWTHQ